MRFFLALALALAPLSAAAHEFWIEAPQWQVPTGAPVIASLRNGEEFKGIEHVYLQSRFTRFELMQSGQRMAVKGRMGDRPALSMTPPSDGLIIAVYESKPQVVAYSEWAKFAAFAAHKDFRGIAARHDARGLPRDGFKEGYTRHAKALLSSGAAAGADSAMGLATEFVALSNPYTDVGPVRVRLLYDGSPRVDAQVEVFERAPDGSVTITKTTRTDAQGEADIAVKPGHAYLLDAVALREGPAETPWETLWASLPFAVPAQ